jgi:hypothetical protein
VASPTWTAESNQASAHFGLSVASAGDVNNDGYADLIFGEPEFSGLQGRVRVFHGGRTGLSSTPATTIPGNTAGARFGSGVGGGGDVNGDGYGDIVVGQQWRTALAFADGRAYVFLGSPAGIPTTPAIELPGTPGDTSDYGRDVAINLDVNGDGFSDVIVGAFGAGNLLSDSGGIVYGYTGGRNDDRRPRLAQAQTLAQSPLALLGSVAPGDESKFRVAAMLRGAGGRTRARLEVEVKPLDVAFDGSGLALGVFTATDLAGTAAGTTVSCSAPLGCRWRVRQRDRDPFFPLTRWISPPGNTASELDLHSIAPPDDDGDGVPNSVDNCPTLANDDQADNDLDLVGDVCDSCQKISNPRVAASFLSANPWATLTGGQRDDDHDGYGNKCDAKFPPATGGLVGPSDLVQYRTASGKSRTGDTCGTTGTRPCAIFDLDETNGLIGPADLAQFRLLNGKTPGPKCATCPLPCTAGTAGTCGAIP